MLDIYAIGDYYADTLNDSREEVLPDLRASVTALSRERFRRIDRFTQLCLLGSALCVEDAHGRHLHIDDKTGLFIGSRFAALANTVEVHRKMMTQGQIPRPAQFINTLSNSAGFYVAKNLQLTGKNIFVSRADASWEATLQCLQIEFMSGVIQQALTGIVDEGVLPLDEQRKRLGVEKETAIGEGSHWFLIRSSQDADEQACSPLATITHVESFYDQVSVKAWIESQFTQPGNTVIVSNSQQSALLNTLSPNKQHSRFTLKSHYYPAQTAGAVSDFIKSAAAGDALITFYGDAHDDKTQRYYLTRTVRH